MSIADEIKKLGDLRSQGLITEAEFVSQKAALLSGGGQTPSHAHTNGIGASSTYANWSDVPLKNKMWLQCLMTLLLVPVGLVLLTFFKSYQRKKDGTIGRVGLGIKAILIVLGLFVWGVGLAQLLGPAAPNNQNAEQMGVVSECGSEAARGALKNAVEQNASNNVNTLRFLEVSDIREVTLSEDHKSRRCNATLVLNSGAEAIGFELTLGTVPGTLIVKIENLPYALGDLPAPETASISDQGSLDADAYFAAAGIRSARSIPAISVSTLIPSYQGVHTRYLAATEIAPNTVAVLFESGTLKADEQGCHSCGAPVSVVWLDDFKDAVHVGAEARDFAAVGGWGHAPDAHPVQLPGGGVGFAFDVGFTQGGVTESGCLIYQVTREGVSLREDLSRAASSDTPTRCA